MTLTPTFWASSVAEELSQGDLLAGVWTGSQFHPRAALGRGQTLKGGTKQWVEVPDLVLGVDGFGHFLARGRSTFALVLSQNCEIDKQGGKVPVLVAPLVNLDSIADEDFRRSTRAGQRYAFFPVDPLDTTVPESYVDLRAISFLPRSVIDGVTRVASAAEAGQERLSAHLVGFFTRIPMAGLRAAI